MFGLWYYISQYWNALTDVSVGALSYPIAFFQNIGHAVGAVLGPIILEPARLLIDFLLGLGYIMQAFFAIIVLIFGLITFPARLLIQVLVLLIYTPINATPFEFNAQFVAFFKSIPLISDLLFVMWAAVIFMVVFSIIKGLGKRLN